MKLIRHGASGCEKPGAIDSQGKARDLSDLVPDFTPEWMAPGRLAALAAVDLQRLPLTLVIDRAGNVRYIHKGFKGEDGTQIAAEVAELLAE